MSRKRAKDAANWAALLRLTRCGLNLNKLIGSSDGVRAFSMQLQQHFESTKFTHVGVEWDASPQLLALAGALAMQCECGITILRPLSENRDSGDVTTASVLVLVELVENGDDLLVTLHRTSQCVMTPSTAVGLAAVCAKEEITFDDLSVSWYCGWTPKGAKLEVATSVSPVRQLEKYKLRHCTTSYEGNQLGEDRNEHWIDGDIAMYAVYDGHGGDIAVNFIQDTLGRIIQDALHLRRSDKHDTSKDETRVIVPSKRKSLSASSPLLVQDILRQSFLTCDQQLKDKLTAYGPTVKASRGYCNTGSCAVTVVFDGDKLYVANVGDCQAVLGLEREATPLHGHNITWDAKVLSTLHDCNNPDEVKRVIERSNDRNAVRLSHDDQLHRPGAEYGGAKRVAGSLMVTRALGDWYLKAEEFSSMPYKPKVPYITAEPDVVVHALTKQDKFVILASDGLWELVPPLLAVQVVSNYGTVHARRRRRSVA
ncbi:hypothetical protein, variant [Aphanomyces invadans]|uniref:PPM-type phosphatase domain-containing protein n=1 Tax=Aphanomyces invadans TaxID=157072 RepID=A0A024TLV8_9STRA|nr:hypothetical protein, variant [Aphanomyces invadans]ETV94322.1 hypothetical protein, variant [Aphanomyces invadans]|eukprot:XP_008877083.1 hypothetical protein, variant [Aphanomyces invadans]